MPSMRLTDRSDPRRMSRYGQPIVDRGANPPALDRRITFSGMAGDQQQDPFAARDRGFERAVDRLPRLVEIVAMEIEDPVGLNRAALEPPIPTAVERVGDHPARRRRSRQSAGWWWSGLGLGRSRYVRSRWRLSTFDLDLVARQRANRRGHPRPQRLFLSG